MATAGSVVVDLLLKTGSFTTDAARAEKSLQNLQKTASSAATGIGKAFAGIAAEGSLGTLSRSNFGCGSSEAFETGGFASKRANSS